MDGTTCPGRAGSCVRDAGPLWERGDDRDEGMVGTASTHVVTAPLL